MANESGKIAKLHLQNILALSAVAAIGGGCSSESQTSSDGPPYITSPSPLRIVSANDGLGAVNLDRADANLPDSITVIDVFPDMPPATRTVAGTVPNSIWGAPSLAIVGGGRYAFIPNNVYGDDPAKPGAPSLVSVVDLDAPDLTVIRQFPLPVGAWQGAALPDDSTAIIISDHQFHIFAMRDGKPVLLRESDPFPLFLTSFAISPDGRSIVAAAAERMEPDSPGQLHLFAIDDNTIHHVSEIGIDPGVDAIDQPFAPRFSPDGSRVLVLNGWGVADKPPLDAVLSIDMTANSPRVTDSIPNVAQGLEHVAFHPSGQFAVIACIDGPYVGHLAVIDLTSAKMQLLYYLPIGHVPEGLEFTADGQILFAQATTSHHIVVYDVDGFKLVRRPYVLRTGENPSSMGISAR
ncbi:hypothetical protein [Altererythrobacter sp. MF3-039]|uniref:hypothetical protein n=1 Tax=Altererythrobacter sp. MF3-039 TaxID=3252901 RepID=UPI00390CCED7